MDSPGLRTYDKLVVANADGTPCRRRRDAGGISIAFEARPADGHRHIVRSNHCAAVLPRGIAQESRPLYHGDASSRCVHGAAELSVVGDEGTLSYNQGA